MGRPKEGKRRFLFLIVLLVAVVGWALFDYFSAQRSEMPAKDQKIVQQAPPGKVVRAIDALGKLAVKETASREGYSRAQFGGDWATIDGCDTRNRILQRDLEQEKLGEDGCTVLSGVLTEDPYTGQQIRFMRGRTTSSAVQIDHVVALSNAWQTGAQSLMEKRRREFANDPLNLLAADGPANMQKGDKDASKWLPRPEYRCRYVARQIAVKFEYKLWVTQNEYSAMNRVLSVCPAQLLPIKTAS